MYAVSAQDKIKNTHYSKQMSNGYHRMPVYAPQSHVEPHQRHKEYNYTPERKLSKMGRILKAKKAPAGSSNTDRAKTRKDTKIKIDR